MPGPSASGTLGVANVVLDSVELTLLLFVEESGLLVDSHAGLDDLLLCCPRGVSCTCVVEDRNDSLIERVGIHTQVSDLMWASKSC